MVQTAHTFGELGFLLHISHVQQIHHFSLLLNMPDLKKKDEDYGRQPNTPPSDFHICRWQLHRNCLTTDNFFYSQDIGVHSRIMSTLSTMDSGQNGESGDPIWMNRLEGWVEKTDKNTKECKTS
ncbi:hypothetical protein Ancab_010656 [Ancistrocladus abbreviatus]